MTSTVPHSDEAERGYIEALAKDPLVAMRCRVPESDFWRPSYRTVYRAMLGLIDARQPVEVATLCDALGPDLDEIGGVPELGEILAGHGLVVHAEHCAAIIERKARDRRLLVACDATSRAIRDGGSSAEHENDLRDALEPVSSDVVEPSDVGEEFRRAYQEPTSDFLPVPLADWQTAGGGLALGCQTVIGARPSNCKTSLALNIVHTLAIHGHASLFLSLEMTPKELHRRLVALHSWHPEFRAYERTDEEGNPLPPLTVDGMRKRRFDYETRVRPWSQSVDGLPIYIEGRIRDLDRLEAKARRMIYARDIRCVVLDYVGKVMDPTAKGDSAERIAIKNTSARFFRIAKDTGVATVVLSQLNRDAEGVLQPTMAHLRASGDMEQDADVIIMLGRESKDAPWGRFTIRKQRDGEADGWLDFAFFGEHMAVADMADERRTA